MIFSTLSSGGMSNFCMPYCHPVETYETFFVKTQTDSKKIALNNRNSI